MTDADAAARPESRLGPIGRRTASGHRAVRKEWGHYGGPAGVRQGTGPREVGPRDRRNCSPGAKRVVGAPIALYHGGGKWRIGDDDTSARAAEVAGRAGPARAVALAGRPRRVDGETHRAGRVPGPSGRRVRGR